MLTPKSQVTSSQSTARRGKGSSVQLIASNESNQKICTGSPKVEKIVKASQKLLSPNQKADVALKNRIGSHRSRREKSESKSTIPLHSRNNTCTNYSISVRNSSVKSQTDSVLEKIIPTVTSKINQTDHLGNLRNLGAQKNEKASITIDLKDIYDNETLETTQSAIKSQTLSSPQASIKPRDFIKAEKRSPCKENNFRFNSVVSPRTCSARKSPLRSVRNSNRIGLNSMMAAKTPTKNLGCHKKSLSLQETIVSSLVNKDGDFPLDLGSALSQYGNQLSIFEKQEISKYPEIYYISDRYHKIQARQEKDFDDDKGDYLVVKNDHICYRYEIVEMLGRGSFGQVLKVYDHKQKEYVALKIIRSQKKFHFQAKIEIDILQYMMSHQGSDYNIMGLKDSFSFRNHVCLVFELMSLSLYDFLKKNKFKGFNINVIRKFAIQILYALKFLSHHKLIHCDLKPENILLKHSNKTGIKIIDFGSSCFESEKLYTYIQSRFYRAPEVILGLTYSSQIDMWSFGCLLYELYVGQPIFPGESEQDQLLCMMEILGAPDKAFIAKSSRKQVFFDDEYNPRITPNSKGKKRFPNIVSLETMIQCEDKSFLDLIKRCLVYDPKERFTPAEALAHEWILGGLPPDLQAQHIKLVESSPEKKASVRVKEEILNPLYAKQHLQLESNRSIKMDTEPNYSNWKSPKSKAQADINDSEISIKEVRSAEKPKKSDDLFEKKPSVSHFPKKKINLNPKQSSEEDSIINVTINLNDTSKDLSIHNYPSKKTHKKSGSMAGSTHRRNDSQSLINNYVSANAATHRSTNRSSGQENQGVSRENKIKRGSHIRDIRIIEEPHESSNFKSIVEEIPSLSTTNTISLSNIFTGDNTKINGPLRDSATFNPSFNKKAVYSGNSMADANSSVETHIQKVTHSSLGSNPGVSTPSHSQIAGSVNCYQQSLSSNKLVDNIGTHSLISKGSSNSINGDVNNNIELYKSINSPSQSRRSQGNIKGESIYSNAQIRRFNISECFSMKFKLESSKYSTANTNATQPEFSNRMNTSNNLNNSALKSPQSNRLGDRNCQKSVLTEKKLNSPSQPNQKNYSPKNSEFLSSNGSIGTKQDVVNSISPRDISFAKLKYPISRKK